MKTVFFFLVLTMLAGTLPVSAKEASSLELVGTIRLEGVAGRIDHMAADVEGHLLFVSALGNNTVEVLDARSNERITTIKGLQHPQGVLYVPEFNTLYITNAGSGACDIYDGRTFKYIDTVILSSDADNIRYDTGAKTVYVGYGKGALGIVDAASHKHIGDIALGDHPESFQLEKNGPRIFVNVPNSKIAVVDRTQRAMVSQWSLLPTYALANYPMALDEIHHRLFSVCRAPGRLVVFDTESGRVVSRLPAVGDADDAFYDEKRKRVYVSGGEGFISIFEQIDADHYKVLGKIRTATKARTSLFVPEWDRFYLAVPQRGDRSPNVRRPVAFGDREAEIRIYEPRPSSSIPR